MIKVLATIVFVTFGLFASYATYELGLAFYGVPLGVLVTAGLLWEVWIQPAQDEAHYQQLLGDIGTWKPQPVSNLQDAQDIVAALETRLNTVTNAYVELRAQEEGNNDEA